MPTSPSARNFRKIMKSIFQNPKSYFIAALVFVVGRASVVFANPTGLNVQSGSATAQQNGSQLNITTSPLAILNWQSFNVAPGETTAFLQPSASSIVFNTIGGGNPTQIFGNLHANGTVILANANGFYFGPNSMVKVGGSFIATTAALPMDIGAGGSWQFSGTPPLASIVNYGQIEVGKNKSLYLIAANIENHGSLAAPQGDVELLAGENVLVSERPDGRGLSATLQLPNGSVDNFGRITADAGTIALRAKVVNQDGVLQANSLVEKNGVIELVAADSVNLGVNSQISAQGDNSTAASAGGQVIVQAGKEFNDEAGGKISVAGGSQGGNGGSVEVSAPKINSVKTRFDASAHSGWHGGKFLLDPDDITLGNSDAGGAIDVTTAFVGFSDILLQASGNISLAQNLTWDLSDSTGLTSGKLTLQAGGDIVFGNKAKIFDANDWSVSLYAGYDFLNNVVQSGVGSIYLNGGAGLTRNGTIQLATGDINLFAGQDILVAPINSQLVSGSIFTTGGGSIFAYAKSGDIVAGTSNGSANGNTQATDYNFTDTGAEPNPFLGGISTAAGGNVTLIAGNNVDSTPKIPTRQAPGASGTYGDGNVTIVAGNQITGNYTLANGKGTLLAGIQVSEAQAANLQNQNSSSSDFNSTLQDLENTTKQTQNTGGNIGAAPVDGVASTAPVRLSLISGSWNVFAANDISIREVNNPNGAFNTSASFPFDYAPDSAVNFWAGNGIELTGANLGRLSSVNRTPVYAPSLSLNAGAGGIKIDNSIILAPSSLGSLSIVTRNGGNLSGAVVAGSTVLNGITMSDSASGDFATFSAAHDNLHLNDANPQPVTLDISGSINSFSLTVPTFANIHVAQDAYNFGFKGRNLSPGQMTSINVDGKITYRGIVSTIDLTADQLADLLPTDLFTDSADTFVTSKLKFDATTGKLIYVGVMSAADYAFLLAPEVLVLQNGVPVMKPAVDENGNPILDANGDPTTVPVTKTLTLDDTQKATITALYTASQSASLGDQGLSLAGPGHFKVSANTMDLGVSGGIRVLAPDAGLAAISPHGADLTVQTVGDLGMTSTKIANESYLGAVQLNVGGTLDVGGQFTTLGDASAPKGIFSTSGGAVSVTAQNNVNVNGSRIAAYNGGNVLVASLTGDVNAGNGGAGYVSLNALELSGANQLIGIPATIPGSGIIATTVFGSHGHLGDITIKAPNGNVNASLGGVLQISFNGADTKNNFVNVAAGKDINASGSGIIGNNIQLKAGGDINGLVIGSQSVDINSQHNVDVTAVSGGGVNISASGSVGGTIIGGGDVSVSGDSIDASVMGGTVSAKGDTSGASLGVPASNIAKDNSQTADNANNVAGKEGKESDDDSAKKKKSIALAQKVSRVTVFLPTLRKLSEASPQEPKI